MRAERGEDARAHEQDEEGIAHGLDLLGASHGSQEHQGQTDGGAAGSTGLVQVRLQKKKTARRCAPRVHAVHRA